MSQVDARQPNAPTLLDLPEYRAGSPIRNPDKYTGIQTLQHNWKESLATKDLQHRKWNQFLTTGGSSVPAATRAPSSRYVQVSIIGTNGSGSTVTSVGPLEYGLWRSRYASFPKPPYDDNPFFAAYRHGVLSSESLLFRSNAATEYDFYVPLTPDPMFYFLLVLSLDDASPSGFRDFCYGSVDWAKAVPTQGDPFGNIVVPIRLTFTALVAPGGGGGGGYE